MYTYFQVYKLYIVQNIISLWAYPDRHELSAFPIVAIEAELAGGLCCRHGHFHRTLSGLFQEAWPPLRLVHRAPFVCFVPREGHPSRWHAVRRQHWRRLAVSAPSSSPPSRAALSATVSLCFRFVRGCVVAELGQLLRLLLPSLLLLLLSSPPHA